ncbi:Site-specific DNA-methyltransferase (adenine-specific) [Saliniradius amylolyticus]|uniref:Site-specific DNA-methyltransferase (adenine-specific) n=1 Tax=Saliniradius amylolyticus TaxID=2183582 RepID=A0A2S2E8C5_9ALTE|nr:Dam family site-specific DNA-(adenine-N6)-methyltransferase [Saliniradius amylolyticus]AWL13197.1 Site-specific DNA-methyltransferase (adenine-specific) [Saliniradius amylolyticus]
MKNTKCRAFLKWAGGKYSLIESIRQSLPEGRRLVEPFVGAGSVFLNTDFQHYWLNDINPDLIALYRILQQQPEEYVRDARAFFNSDTNQKERYYALREEFNLTQDSYHRSLLFLYLNRHGYNGLCRYNLSGKFNVPFGRYKKPYFPERELYHFAEKAQQATFTCLPFTEVFEQLGRQDVVYCDPPYAPISQTANFTSYATKGFSMAQQQELAEQAHRAAKESRVPVLISNHDTEQTRTIYQQASRLTRRLKVSRYISQKGHKRSKVDELFAFYEPARINLTTNTSTNTNAVTKTTPVIK